MAQPHFTHLDLCHHVAVQGHGPFLKQTLHGLARQRADHHLVVGMEAQFEAERVFSPADDLALQSFDAVFNDQGLGALAGALDGLRRSWRFRPARPV